MIKIFDNIGCEFTYNVDDNSLVLLNPLPGYSSLSIEQSGFSIPYLARNVNNKEIEYELGVGYLEQVNNKLVLKDRKISVSSNNNQAVNFNIPGNKQFYLFVHSVNFDNAFNNVFLVNDNFNAEAVKSVYIVDISNGYVIGSLPDPQSCKAVEIEFRTVGDDGSLSIRYQETFNITLNQNNYTKVVSTGDDWVELKDNNSVVKSQSIDNSFGIMSDPSGEDRSLQFSNNGSFDGSTLYQGSNNKILAGSSSEASAKHIIPTSGSYDFVINQTKDGSNFIVHGTGNAPGYPSKNLYFTNDGKLGINMPSGVGTGSLIKPSTILHIFNTLCREGIRLENRANCYPADITLYDNPYSPRPDGTGIARIVFAGKDSSSNKTTYGQIETKVKSVSSKLGQIDVSVADGANSFTTISSSAAKTNINSNSASIEVGSNISISGTNVKTSGTNISLSAISNINLSGTTIIENGLRLPYVSGTNVLLGIDGNKQIIATTGFKIPGLSTTKECLLTTTSDGTVVAEVPKDSYWPYESNQKIGGRDVTWDRYPYRVAQVCLNRPTKELEVEPSPTSEFSIGDQIAILNLADYSTTYRYISNITVTNDTITVLILDQNVLFTASATNLRVYSVSKGGVLTNTIFTSGVVSDATDIVLSTRPGTNTIFNSKLKNIDFTVYGSEPTAALNIIANAAIVPGIAGNYFKYATQFRTADGADVPPFPSRIDNVGSGSTNSSFNNTANFADAAGTTWPGKVSAIGNNGRPSFYGTYDQNGNVSEWIEDDVKQGSFSSDQYVCGGSWKTVENNGLRSYVSVPRYSGLDDVGFRVCSRVSYINDLEDRLSFSFVNVGNTNNPPDTGLLYDEELEEVSKPNLGTVTYPYRISKYEVTNSQYVEFLNSVATGIGTISGLYKDEMSSSPVGGISRSGTGPFAYSVKENMHNMPVVFVDYVSAIRYINWLSNGAPTGIEVTEGITEIGSYVIEGGINSNNQISKLRDQNYWLPSLNEWHKAAYYVPENRETQTPFSAVTIRRDSPYEYASSRPFQSGTGLLASLSVEGYLFTDYLKMGQTVVTDTDRTYSSVVDPGESIIAITGNTYLINQQGSTSDVIGRAAFTPTQTILTQPLLITTGNLSSTNSSAGILITHSGLNYVDTSGNTIPGGLFPGPAGGYLFKDPNGTDIISSSGNLIAVDVTGAFYPVLKHTQPYNVIHNDPNNVLSDSSWFTVGKTFNNINPETTSIVGIHRNQTSDSTEKKPLLYTDRIIVGPPLPGYSGSLLTHAGVNEAYWQPNEFLKAPGAVWTRYPKRAVEFLFNDDGDVKFLRFVSIDPSSGGTGPIDRDTIVEEFALNETIAIYNQAREVIYVKLANIGLLDSRDQDVNESFFLDEATLKVAVCPSIPSAFATNSALELGEGDPNNGKLIGYAFSIQKGAHLDMTIEPEATEKFACLAADVNNSEYTFKPSTVNTLSIRPGIYTTFNKMAEDIDFIVYGHRKTLFTRYEPDWFNQDAHGVPTGLTPAFRVHSKLDSSCIGSVESGVFVNTLGQNSIASGISLDLNPKITINSNEPYRISSLNNIKLGVLLPSNSPEVQLELEKKYGMIIPSTGVLVSGTNDLSNYADLTVSGVTYTDALITKDVVLGPLWTGTVPVPYELSLTQKIYAPNYPLTINQLGQVVSMIPPPAPRVPTKPLNVTVTPKNSAIILEWDTPEDIGGSEILGYVVEYSITGGSSWSVYDQINAQTLLPVVPNRNTIRYLETNIINNTGYVFRLRAYNSIGLGPYSSPSAAVTPRANLSPTTPTNLRIVVGEDSYYLRNSQNITLEWSPSSTVQGVTVSEYIVEYWVYDTFGNKDIKLATWTTATNSPATTTQINLTGIDLGPLYYFSVTAKGSDNNLSQRSLYASLGSDPDPRPIGTVSPVVTENPYNFGSVIFVGSCA